ncbi:MAG: MFS transporter [Clostridia bacterium]
MNQAKPYSKSFIILVIGQIISIIGNSSISFLLSLYVLELTGSASIFATITAICAIPWLIAGPLGGVICDKFSKKKIMVSLDFLVAILIFTVATVGFSKNAILIISITKILLETIKALYHPCSSSATSFLVDKDFLLRASSIGSQINSVASVAGVLLAGVLFNFFELTSILYAVSILFIFACTIECFMVIPKKSRTNKSDLNINYSFKESLTFIFNKNKYFFKYLILRSVITGLCINAVISIGLPYIINVYLNLPAIYYSISCAIISLGSLLAGVILWKLNNKVNFSISGYIFIFQAIFVFLMGLSLCFFTGIKAFVFICVSLVFIMIAQSSLYTLMNVFLQEITAPKMLGKVMSIVPIIAGFCDPGGQIIYGYLFDIQGLSPGIIIVASSVIILVLSFFTVKSCKKAYNQLDKDFIS